MLCCRFSCAQLFATLWTVACQASLSMGFSLEEYWSGLPCSSPGNLPDPGIKPASLKSPALAGGFFTSSTTLEAPNQYICVCLLSHFSHVQLFATPWTAACQPSLSITNSQSLLKLMSIELERPRINPWVGNIPWRRAWQPTPVFLPGESQGWRSLVGCCLWGCTELDTTEAT